MTMQHDSEMTRLERSVLEQIQQDVPLVPRPFRTVAERVGAGEQEVIAAISHLRARRVIRQVSAIFDTRRLGYASSLVAARVEPDRLERAAAVVGAHPGVSHNYERDHDYNLWFTIAVSPDSSLGLERTVEVLGAEAGIDAMRLLPALRVFRIGVNFDVAGTREAAARRDPRPRRGESGATTIPRAIHDDPRDVEAIRALQRDLPAVEEPFALLAAEHGFTVDELLERGERLRAERVMRRFAAVLHHRTAGFRANGMGVWQVEPDRIEEAGRTMATFEGVSHCYARPTYPDWPYSLFTMTHGRTRVDCERVLAAISSATGLHDYDVLYSTREFKKVRVRYFMPEQAEWERDRALVAASLAGAAR